jgi:hypothetical protein
MRFSQNEIGHWDWFIIDGQLVFVLSLQVFARGVRVIFVVVVAFALTFGVRKVLFLHILYLHHRCFMLLIEHIAPNHRYNNCDESYKCCDHKSRI